MQGNPHVRTAFIPAHKRDVLTSMQFSITNLYLVLLGPSKFCSYIHICSLSMVLTWGLLCICYWGHWTQNWGHKWPLWPSGASDVIFRQINIVVVLVANLEKLPPSSFRLVAKAFDFGARGTRYESHLWQWEKASYYIPSAYKFSMHHSRRFYMAYTASSSHGFWEAAICQGTPCYKEKIMSYSCMMFVDSKNIYGNPGLQHLNFTNSPVFFE